MMPLPTRHEKALSGVATHAVKFTPRAGGQGTATGAPRAREHCARRATQVSG